VRPYSIIIDADASPSGYIAWYNPTNEKQKQNLRLLKPAVKNERYGVQRMEMLAVYFALADNLVAIRKAIKRGRKGRRVNICVRSDSKSTVEQLQGLCAIRDVLMQRIFRAIAKLLARIRCTIRFDYLGRSSNIAGLLIEQKRRQEREAQMALEKIDVYEMPSLAAVAPLVV